MKTKDAVAGLLVIGLLSLAVVSLGPAAAAEEEQTVALPGMVLIPAGPFMMGDSFGEGASDELPVQEVYVSAFYMDRYEVTKALWDEVAAWAQANGYDIGPSDSSGKAPDDPVGDVSWYEVVKWANARSEKEGLTPCYYVDEALNTVYRTGQVDVETEWVNWNADGYRLPTEAEWEKAARGGAVGQRYPWGDDIDCTKANYRGCLGSPASVGTYGANGYGLFDMAGNVWEWCWDWYEVQRVGETDPRGPGGGSFRVYRGGSWGDRARFLRASVRSNSVPSDESSYRGFRLVVTAP